MPTVRFGDPTIECEYGATLRDVLLEAGTSPHSGRANAANCRGRGTCGTCAVAVEGRTATVTVRTGEGTREFEVPEGTNLREALLERGFSPYSRYTERANCGGRGLCATCGVRIDEGPPPDHWHDRLADHFGYPRLSCQETVTGDVTVGLVPDKLIWGPRDGGSGDCRRDSGSGD